MRRFILALVLAGLFSLVAATPAFAQQTCSVSDNSTKQVLPGVTLTYDSSFLCSNAPERGSYRFTVTVTNAASSAGAVIIDRFRLSHTTPRPGGRGPNATGSASGLPIVVAPGESETFRVNGTYELVRTDEGSKANLHFRAGGRGAQSGDPFRLGINAQIRGTGAAESGGGGPDNGSGGPLPFVFGRPGGPPAFVFGR